MNRILAARPVLPQTGPRRSMLWILPACALLVSACAAPPGTGARDDWQARNTCFSPSQVRGYSRGPGQTLFLNVGAHRYELTVGAGCPALDHAMGFTLEPGSGGLTRLCPGDWTQIAVRGDLRQVEHCRARIEGWIPREQAPDAQAS